MAAIEKDHYAKVRQLFGDIVQLKDAGQKEPLLFCFIQHADYTKEGAVSASLVLTEALYSDDLVKALTACHVLMLCFEQSHHHFRDEVLTFRFLNKLIKLVAPEYRAFNTPVAVRQCVADILYSWRHKMADNAKICEAYSLIQRRKLFDRIHVKTRVICADDISDISAISAEETDTVRCDTAANPKSVESGGYMALEVGSHAAEVLESERRSAARGGGSVLEDEARGAQLRRLLQSRHEHDRRAANNLIRAMVKEEEARTERLGQLTSEMQTARETVQLLDEMLTGYNSFNSTGDDCDVMCQLKSQLLSSCQRFHQLTAVSDDYQIEDVISLSESINAVIARCDGLFGNSNNATTASGNSAPLCLLDLSPQGQTESQSDGTDLVQLQSTGVEGSLFETAISSAPAQTNRITSSPSQSSDGNTLSTVAPSLFRDSLLSSQRVMQGSPGTISCMSLSPTSLPSIPDSSPHLLAVSSSSQTKSSTEVITSTTSTRTTWSNRSQSMTAEPLDALLDLEKSLRRDLISAPFRPSSNSATDETLNHNSAHLRQLEVDEYPTVSKSEPLIHF